MQLSVSPRHAGLDTAPVFAAVVAAEKTPRRGNVITLFAAGKVFDVVHVDIVDADAAVVPGFAAIAAEQHAAMFEQDVKQILIVGMNKNMAHMRRLDALQPRRHIPFLFTSSPKSSMPSRGSNFLPPSSLRNSRIGPMPM